jgi:dienelactone hydrolase
MLTSKNSAEIAGTNHSAARHLVPSLLHLLAGAFLLGFVLFAASASAQQPAPAPASPRAAAQNPATTWTAPPGSQISMDRRSGRFSVNLPVQPTDGSREQQMRFADWAAHPYAGSGPYPATREEPASLPTHTVYLPADLSSTPKLPIILWGNGGCRNTSVEFTRFLGELASHGYIVIAVGRSNIPFLVIRGSIAAVADTRDANGNLQVIMDPSYFIKGLDWAVAENARKGSPLYGKLDTTKVAAMGQSCGGPQAFHAAADPRITTVVALNSSFPTQAMAGMNGAPKDDFTEEKLTIPAAMFTGGPADTGYTGAVQSYKGLPSALPALLASLNTVGHTGAYPMPDLRWVAGVLSWLDWQLKGDAKARDNLAGPACSLCSDPDWWIDTQNIP